MGQTAWRRDGWDVLAPYLCHDPELGGTPVKLVDAEFICFLARAGLPLIRREDLPEAAFVEFDHLTQQKHKVCIVCVSHPWLQPDHPDPKAFNLQYLVAMLGELQYVHKRMLGEHTWAVMIDFCSICQKGPHGEERSPIQAKLFQRALGSLTLFYAHPNTITLKITAMPKGYPRGYAFPRGIPPNKASYYNRGWCYFESSISNMAKEQSYFVLDLAKMSTTQDLSSLGPKYVIGSRIRECMADRRPVCDPAAFRRVLEEKSFTSKKADLRTVGDLYAKAFFERISTATTLKYNGLCWGDAELVATCVMIGEAKITTLTCLDLSDNPGITSAGIMQLADALQRGMAPALRQLRLGQIGDDALRALRSARPGLQMKVEEWHDGTTPAEAVDRMREYLNSNASDPAVTHRESGEEEEEEEEEEEGLRPEQLAQLRELLGQVEGLLELQAAVSAEQSDSHGGQGESCMEGKTNASQLVNSYI